ncbi:hypothetical protein B7494_g2208 [Chlorociboria aeruginascens]|nr:hypothetical protein B7494_g2208 [Chlorociboria aeruginascens]
MQTAIPRIHKPKKVTRVSQLEEKVDGLVSLLKSSQQLPINDSLDTSNHQYQQPAFHQSLSHHSSAPYSPPTNITTPVSDPSFYDQESILKLFQLNMAPQFPFVALPLNSTVATLSQTKPFLLKTIIMIATLDDPHRQAKLLDGIMEAISQQIIIRSEKSLDLLQGLIILLGWFQLHAHIARRHTTLLQLGTALIFDLGLNKEVVPINGYDQSVKGLRLFPMEGPNSTPRTLEERRAFLGHVYLTSVMSVFLSYMNSHPYTNYTEHCIQIIEESGEYPTDQMLVQLMKAQHIAEDISEALPRDNLDFSPASFGPISLCIKTLQKKLNTFKRNIPPLLQQNPFLLIQYHSVLTFLTETALFIPLPSRSATLHACLTATQATLSSLFSVPVYEYHKLSYGSWLQIFHTLGTLSNLSSFESDDWDPSHARRVVDLSLVLDNIIIRFGELNAAKGGKENTIYTKVVERLTEYKESFGRKRIELLSGITQAPLNNSDTHIDLTGSGGASINELDDAFFEEIMANWDTIPFQQ